MVNTYREDNISNNIDQNCKKILVVRNDKLGDFMLSIPAIAVLKKSLNCHISVLVSKQVKNIASCCPIIDDVFNVERITNLVKFFNKKKFDAIIVFFSTIPIAVASMFIRKHSYVLAPATKLWQFFYHNRLKQRRSLSKKAEYQYNIDLVKHYLKTYNIDINTNVKPPFWYLKNIITRQNFLQKHNLSNANRLLFIHPGCGGSTANLTLKQYADLAIYLAKEDINNVICITGSSQEIPMLNNMVAMIGDAKYLVFNKLTQLELLQHINLSDIFISGGTGPLHMAGVLNKKTVTFYPNELSVCSTRWQTCNDNDKKLIITPENSDMASINIVSKIPKILKFLNY